MFKITKFNKEAEPIDAIFKHAGLVVTDKNSSEYLHEVSRNGLFSLELVKPSNTDFYTEFSEADARMDSEPDVQRGHATVNEMLSGTALDDLIGIGQREAYLGFSTHYQLNVFASAGNDYIYSEHVYDAYVGMGRDEGVPTQLLNVWGGDGLDVFEAPNSGYSGMHIQDMELLEVFFTHPSYNIKYFSGSPAGEWRQPNFVNNAREVVLENEQGYRHYLGTPDDTRLVQLYETDSDMNVFILLPEVQYNFD